MRGRAECGSRSSQSSMAWSIDSMARLAGSWDVLLRWAPAITYHPICALDSALCILVVHVNPFMPRKRRYGAPRGIGTERSGRAACIIARYRPTLRNLWCVRAANAGGDRALDPPQPYEDDELNITRPRRASSKRPSRPKPKGKGQPTMTRRSLANGRKWRVHRSAAAEAGSVGACMALPTWL